MTTINASNRCFDVYSIKNRYIHQGRKVVLFWLRKSIVNLSNWLHVKFPSIYWHLLLLFWLFSSIWHDQTIGNSSFYCLFILITCLTLNHKIKCKWSFSIYIKTYETLVLWNHQWIYINWIKEFKTLHHRSLNFKYIFNI